MAVEGPKSWKQRRSGWAGSVRRVGVKGGGGGGGGGGLGKEKGVSEVQCGERLCSQRICLYLGHILKSVSIEWLMHELCACRDFFFLNPSTSPVIKHSKTPVPPQTIKSPCWTKWKWKVVHIKNASRSLPWAFFLSFLAMIHFNKNAPTASLKTACHQRLSFRARRQWYIMYTEQQPRPAGCNGSHSGGMPCWFNSIIFNMDTFPVWVIALL